MRSAVVALAIGIATIFDCSPPAVTIMNVTQACQDRAYSYCSALDQCSSHAIQIRFGDVATCESNRNTLCLNSANAPSTGSTVANIEACVAATPTWACSDLIYNQNAPPACAPAAGTLPVGASCVVNAQCQTTWCNAPIGSACGVCAPLPQVGDPCTTTICPSGLHCETAIGVCVAFAQLGSACSSTQPCNESLTCVANVCQPSVSMNGALCSFTGAGCDEYQGLTCNTEAGTCVTAVLAQPGQACGQVGDQNAYCIAGACVRGVCVAYGSMGGPCDIDGTPCIEDTRCVVTTDGGTTGTCQFTGSVACP